MEILFDSERFTTQYNCTSYEVSDVPITDRQNLLFGIAMIVLFVIFECLHAISLIAMYRFALQHTAYKLLFIQSIGHMSCLWVTALLSGLFLIQGSVYCSNPILNIVAGMIALFCWAFTTSLSVLLALERCLEQAFPKLGRKLFNKDRLLPFWLLPILLYSIYYGFFTVPLTFCSLTWNWEYDPHKGYLNDTDDLYENTLDSVHTIAVAVILPTLYLLYAAMFTLKWTQVTQLTELDSRKMRKVFLQVFILSLLLTLFCTNDSLSNYIPWSDTINMLNSLLWVLLDGVPPIVYLALNGSIRDETAYLFRSLHRTKVITIAPQHTQQIGGSKTRAGVKQAWISHS